jgi:hypothetical protein
MFASKTLANIEKLFALVPFASVSMGQRLCALIRPCINVDTVTDSSVRGMRKNFNTDKSRSRVVKLDFDVINRVGDREEEARGVLGCEDPSSPIAAGKAAMAEGRQRFS